MPGWFVDRTSDGWAGADDVEIYLGTIGNGGALLTHAFFARHRPDVAATFGRPDWAASSWSAIIPTTALVPGTTWCPCTHTRTEPAGQRESQRLRPRQVAAERFLPSDTEGFCTCRRSS